MSVVATNTGRTNGKGRRKLTAAAVRVNLEKKHIAKSQAARRQSWQDDAWAMFDDVGPVKFSCWFLGNAIAKLHLFAAVRPLDDPEAEPIPVTDAGSGIPPAVAARAQAEIERIKGPLGGRGEILRVLEMNLEVAAECYIVGIGPKIDVAPDPNNPSQTITTEYDEEWNVRSILEVEVKSDGTYRVRDSPNMAWTELDPNNSTVIRVYQRHPAWADMADCHMRAALTDCEALVLLNNEVKAEAKSRQSNGVLLIPNGVSWTASNKTEIEVDEDGNTVAQEEGDLDDELDPVEDVLADAMLDPIEDPGSPWSVFPVILRGDKDELKEVRHISLQRDTSQILEQRIQGRVEAIARSMNLPVEVVVGHQQTTFANAAQVDEDTFEDHIQPRCELICDAWTIGLLQPALIDAGIPPELAERIIVWYDPSPLIQRIDPIDSADTGLTENAISWDAWRRVKGWSDDDKPNPIEQLVRAILHQRSWDPGLVSDVVRAVDPGILPDEPPAQPAPPAQLPPGAPPAALPPGQPAMSLTRALLQVLIAAREQTAERDPNPILAARATNAMAHTNPGARLHAIDRETRTKIMVAANHAMNRTLERAGNRIKAKLQRTQLSGIVRRVHPIYAAQQIGPALLATHGFHDDELIGDDAFAGLRQQFVQWGTDAQRQALRVAGDTVKLSKAERETVEIHQAANLSSAWSYMEDELHKLAEQRLYEPDPMQVGAGEFDPSARVPAGLIRQALAIAGGDTGIQQIDAGQYVAVSSDGPLGGIATGDTIDSTLRDHEVLVEAYQWDYGPGFRQTPFPEHEDLDGTVFSDFGSEALGTTKGSDWIGTEYFPGDHDGCQCDFVPVYVLPEDVDEEV